MIDGGPKKDDDNDPFVINYCVPNWCFAFDVEDYNWILEYDTKTSDIYVPLFVGETLAERQPSDRYRVWHFNGKHFDDMGERPRKGLHQSVGDYKQLLEYFETDDYIVRVDSLDSNQLRYASWKKPKTTSDKPDVVIKGGVRNKPSVGPGQLQPCDNYRFESDGYEYIVNYCIPQREEDGSVVHYEFLVINKDGKRLLKQPRLIER